MKVKSFSIMICALGYFFTPLLSEASTLKLTPLPPAQVEFNSQQKTTLIETNLMLQIDAEKSFFEIREQPHYQYFLSSPWALFDNEKDYQSKKYPISGKIELFDKYSTSGTYSSTETNITKINIASGLSNISLDSEFFWVPSQSVRSEYLNSSTICACSTAFILPEYFSTQKSSSFDGENLSLSGDGNFKLDETSGLYVIQTDSSSTHRIRYHIEANVVSNVPIPTSFYLFFSGLGLLSKYRQRKH